MNRTVGPPCWFNGRHPREHYNIFEGEKEKNYFSLVLFVTNDIPPSRLRVFLHEV